MSGFMRSVGIAIMATLITSATAAKSSLAEDACSFLTKEDAAAALGEAATGPKLTGPMPAGAGATVSACEYTGSGIHRVQLNLTQLPASSVPMYKGMCAKQSNDGLAGMGEVACWYNDQQSSREPRSSRLSSGGAATPPSRSKS